MDDDLLAKKYLEELQIYAILEKGYLPRIIEKINPRSEILDLMKKMIYLIHMSSIKR